MYLQEQLLVEKCLRILIEEYRMDKEKESPTAHLDWKLNFLSFLNNNLEDQVLYGFEFLENHKQEFMEEYNLVYPMILEYTLHRLDGFLNCSDRRIKEPEQPKHVGTTDEHSDEWKPLSLDTITKEEIPLIPTDSYRNHKKSFGFIEKFIQTLRRKHE